MGKRDCQKRWNRNEVLILQPNLAWLCLSARAGFYHCCPHGTFLTFSLLEPGRALHFSKMCEDKFSKHTDAPVNPPQQRTAHTTTCSSGWAPQSSQGLQIPLNRYSSLFCALHCHWADRAKHLGTCAFPRPDENILLCLHCRALQVKEGEKTVYNTHSYAAQEADSSVCFKIYISFYCTASCKCLPYRIPPPTHPLCLPVCQIHHASTSIFQLPKPVGLGLHFSVSQATSRNLVIAIPHIFSSALFFSFLWKSQLARGCRLLLGWNRTFSQS